ncbi:hypothetical protein JHK86_000449 [Glycine max]|nr:hypothetical protein JHK86_000449 [Glycine max]
MEIGEHMPDEAKYVGALLRDKQLDENLRYINCTTKTEADDVRLPNTKENKLATPKR